MGKFNEIIKNVKQSFDGNDIDINILPDKVVIDSEQKVIEVNNTLLAANLTINGISSVAFTSDEKDKLSKITTPMQVIGRVDSVEMLPLNDVAIGSVYLVGLEGCADFEEYIVISLEPTTYESLGKMVTSSDWLQTDETAADYIDNKPAILAGAGTNSIVEGDIIQNIATGNYAHAEGSNTRADGNYSHTEGSYTTARGAYSHAEGSTTTANGIYSHTEGSNTTAAGIYSHTEGNSTTAYGDYSHAEGERTKATGHYSHAEGSYSEVNGRFGHVEGAYTVAAGECSHAEGNRANVNVLAYAGHAEGQLTTVSGTAAHAEGRETTASGLRSHAEGYQTTAAGDMSHTQGNGTQANRKSQTAIGEYNIADGTGATARGNYIEIAGNGIDDSNRSNARTLDWQGNEVLAGALFAAGNITSNGVDLNAAISALQQNQSNWAETDETAADYILNRPAILSGGGTNAIIEGDLTQNIASGDYSHAEGYKTTVSGGYSHAEGYGNEVIGQSSHAEGFRTTVSGNYSHAEGQSTTASGSGSHAEGQSTTASGAYAHAEGSNTIASGDYSHAEGQETTANGAQSHAQGYRTTASGYASHAEGITTTATHKSQHVFGEYNITDPSTSLATARGNYVEIVGNGDIYSTRSNARTLDWSGNEVLSGKITANGVNLNDELNLKQDALGFTPENSANKKTTLDDNSDTYYPTQKAVKTAVDAKADGAEVSAIRELIPTQASSTNQLADRDFVNSSIVTSTATFRGTFTSVEDLPTTGVDNNDYTFVKVFDPIQTDEVLRYDRYKWSDGWSFEYSLNNSSFTAAQWDAINSNATAAIISDLLSHASNLSNPHAVTKSQVGLENVDNTSDLDKPLSAAAIAGLAAKQDSLIAGNNITIVGNTISSIGGGGQTTVYKSITIENPTASENMCIFYAPVAMTITEIRGVITGATSVSFKVVSGTSRNAVTTEHNSSAVVCSSVTTGDVATITTAAVAAGSWVAVKTSAVSGAPSELVITLSLN